MLAVRRPWYRRRWVRLLLALHAVLLLLATPFVVAVDRAVIRPDRPQPTWEGPLTPAQRQTIFDALWTEVERRYPYLELKGIDWDERRAAYWPEAAAAPDDQAFYRVLERLVASLNDGHSSLVWYPGKQPQTAPPFALGWVEEQYVVLKVGTALAGQVQPGDVILTIDGRPAAAVADELRPYTGGAIAATDSPVSARLIGSVGYIRIDAWRGDVVQAVDEALAVQVAGRFLTRKEVFTRITFRAYPFWTPTITRTVKPRGPWTYTGPVAVLIDGGVYSSSDFFVGGLARSGRVVTIGSPTGGGSGNPAVITLPGGAKVRLSRWIEYFGDGTPVEGNGARPAVEVAATVADIAAGRDPVLERALEMLGAGGRE